MIARFLDIHDNEKFNQLIIDRKIFGLIRRRKNGNDAGKSYDTAIHITPNNDSLLPRILGRQMR